MNANRTDEPDDPSRARDAARPPADDGAERASSSTGSDAAASDLSALRDERDRLEEQLLRTKADLANIRRRQAKELDEARRRAVETMSAELLPVLDNFHLALAAHEQHARQGDENREVRAMLDGLVMVRSLLEGALERHGLTEIRADGQDFDPNVHEAVAIDPDSAASPGTITQVMQRGYRLGDKVLRASRVMVAGSPDDARANGGRDDAEA